MKLVDRLMKLKKRELCELYAKLLREGSTVCLGNYHGFDVVLKKICRSKCHVYGLCRKIKK